MLTENKAEALNPTGSWWRRCAWCYNCDNTLVEYLEGFQHVTVICPKCKERYFADNVKYEALTEEEFTQEIKKCRRGLFYAYEG